MESALALQDNVKQNRLVACFHFVRNFRGRGQTLFDLRTDFRLDSILIGCCVAVAFRDETRRARLSAVVARVPFALTVPPLTAWSLLAGD